MGAFVIRQRACLAPVWRHPPRLAATFLCQTAIDAK